MKYYIYILVNILITSFFVFAIIDNYSIKVVETNVQISNLPDKFNGYKILQLSDLHSRDFDNNLSNKINSLDYDIILFTGDMMDNDDYAIESFEKLVKNIDKKDIILYVDGNNGPMAYNYLTGRVTKFGEKIQSLGITLLKDTYVINKDSERIVFSNFDIVSNVYNKGYLSGKYVYSKDLKIKLLEYNNDIKIGVSHYPASEGLLKYINSKKEPSYYSDLIIAGHYHGGQIRIPGYGAVFIPTNNTKEQFFPKQEFVSGLVSVGSVKQYVSRGLGASEKINMLKFRLFNTPELDLITLKK